MLNLVAGYLRGRLALALAILVLAVSSAWGAVPEGTATGTESGIHGQVDLPPADLVVANRVIFTMRAASLGNAPAERAKAVSLAVEALVERGGPLHVTTRPLPPEGVGVLIDGTVAFRVLTGDVNPEGGEGAEQLAATAAANLQQALREMREARDARALLPALGYALLATALLALALWMLMKGHALLARRAHAYARHRLSVAMPKWTKQAIGETTLGNVLTLPAKLFAALIAILLVYWWVGFVLKRFPYTRPWGEALRDNLVGALGQFGQAMLKAIPGLLFVALIIVLARVVVRVVRAVFNGIAEGRIEVGLIDATTARPTGQLIITAIWIVALVAAYPYIPGSGSEAFKGIGVFVGLMMSIGASGVVNQAVSGLMLMYTKALRPGEFVKIGETEGTVKSVGFVTTRIETLRHEEVNIPNAVIVSSVTRNYSRLAAQGGLWLATKVTIGYDTPWRQVKALLELAAARTEGVAKDPAPRVLQTALQDFYPEYTLLVNVTDPLQRLAVLDRLHANIQDAFNEYGVQIMSPNYEDDPETAKIVPREKWFEPPAAR